jgi:hypothetical protein
VYQDKSGNRLRAIDILGDIQRMEFWRNPDGQFSMWGAAKPGYAVYIETSHGYTATGWADPYGDFGSNRSLLIEPGDIVTVTAGLGELPLVILFPEMLANSDSTNETVSGYLGGYNDWPVEVYPWWDEPMTTTMTGGDGTFSALFDHIPQGGRGYIRFIDNSNPYNVAIIFHRTFYDLEPNVTVNYAHDWIESQYDPGHSVAITVTDGLGEIKATAHGMTAFIPWWGGDTGFSTGYNVFWDGDGA